MINVDEIVLCSAQPKHYPFLAKAIVEADKGDKKLCSYCGLFGIQEDEFRHMLVQIFDEELEGCEFGASTFLVLECQDTPVAAVSSWIEGECGMPSWLVRMSALHEYVPEENLKRLTAMKHITDSMVISRTPATMQVESVFVENEFRGRGLANRLFTAHALQYKQKDVFPETVELLTYVNNKSAIQAYNKIGFEVVETTLSENPDILNYYPDKGMIRMQTSVNHFLVK